METTRPNPLTDMLQSDQVLAEIGFPKAMKVAEQRLALLRLTARRSIGSFPQSDGGFRYGIADVGLYLRQGSPDKVPAFNWQHGTWPDGNDVSVEAPAIERQLRNQLAEIVDAGPIGKPTRNDRTVVVPPSPAISETMIQPAKFWRSDLVNRKAEFESDFLAIKTFRRAVKVAIEADRRESKEGRTATSGNTLQWLYGGGPDRYTRIIRAAADAMLGNSAVSIRRQMEIEGRNLTVGYVLRWSDLINRQRLTDQIADAAF